MLQGLFIPDIVTSPANSTKSPQIQLVLQEIAFNGTMGPKFYLTLHNDFAEEWVNNLDCVRRRMTGKYEQKLLIICQSIKSLSYMYSFYSIPSPLLINFHLPIDLSPQITNGEIHFHLTSNENGAYWVKLKNYFSDFSSAKKTGFHNYSYITLTAAAENTAKKFHSYAVVEDILQVSLSIILC